MYAVLLTLALTPDVPVAHHKAAAGCTGTVKAAPAASCYGSSGYGYRAPVRHFLHRATTPRTLYYPATAVYVPHATATQSAAPPVFRTPIRNAAAALCPNGRCPAR